MTYIAVGVTAVLGAITASIVFWNSYGWLTIEEWEDHVADTVEYSAMIPVVSMHDERIMALEMMAGDLGDQLKGYIAVAQIIRDLLRAECQGATNLRAQINMRKAEYQQLTGEVFIEPECDSIPGGG